MCSKSGSSASNPVDSGRIRRRLAAVLAVVVAVAFTAGFWLTERDDDPAILGHYSRGWFALSVMMTLAAGLIAAAVVRRLLRPPRPAGGEPTRLSPRKRVLFAALVVLPVLLGAELWLRHTLREVAGRNPAIKRLRPDASFHALLQITSRAQVDGRWERVYAGRRVNREKSTRFRIICLGGSTTRGVMVADDCTWPYLLEENLRSAGHDVEVVNAGQPWYTTTHSLTNYAVQLRYLDPDLVIVMHTVNDLGRSFPAPRELPPEWDYGSALGPMYDLLLGRLRHHRNERDYYRPPPCALWAFFCAATEVDSRYYSALRGAGPDPAPSLRSARTLPQMGAPDAMTTPLDSLADQVTREGEVDVGLEAFSTLEPFRNHLEYLVRIVQADGVPVMLCTQAHIYSRPTAGSPEDSVWGMRNDFFRPTDDTCVSADSMRRAMAAARDAILDIADRRGTLFMDVENLIEGDPACFLDDYHLTKAGNQRVARAMADQLAPVLDTLPDREGEETP